MALCIPPDLILTVLEGVTAIIHYCLLDPTSQYHQVRALQPSSFFFPPSLIERSTNSFNELSIFRV